jgi:hypothetical protein
MQKIQKFATAAVHIGWTLEKLLKTGASRIGSDTGIRTRILALREIQHQNH